MNEWIWPKRLQSPKKRWRAHILCNHDCDAFIVPKLGSLKWVEDDLVALYDKDEKGIIAMKYSGQTGTWVVDGPDATRT